MTIDEARTARTTESAEPLSARLDDGPMESLGVALSGGGIRAALFSLGVLIGLVDSGQNARVKHVSSVSGGSIVNAAIAHSSEFGSLESADEIQSVAEPIAEMLCRRGAFVLTYFTNRAGIAAFARFVGPQLGGLVAGAAIVWGSVDGLLREGHLERMPWSWIAIGSITFLIVVTILSRGVAQEAIYASLLGQLPTNGARGKTAVRLEGMPEQQKTTHVIVATDLVSGNPVCFSRDFVFCPAYGWGKPARTKTASAVYASAAFPGAFPAKRFQRHRFGFQNGNASPPIPRVLKLADGGVHNNLGTDWFDILEKQQTEELWKFGRLDPPLALAPVTRRIVVNAGAASRGVRRVRPFLALPRIMTVLYDNTVQPRLQQMREVHDSQSKTAPFVIDISESPYEIARRHAEVDLSELPDAERENAEIYKKRAELLVKWLGRKPQGFWIDFTRTTSNAPTKLTKAGLESGARMMFHGYLSAIVVMNILYDAVPPSGIPEGVKDESYFVKLADRHLRPKNANHDAPDASG